MDIAQYASKIERLALRPELAAPEIHRAATEAARSNFAAIAVAPVWVAKVAAMLRGSGVGVATVVGYPNGTNKATLKAIEATSSIKDGASEIEIVPFLPNVLSGDVDALRAELLEINRAARTTNRDVVIKVWIDGSRGLGDELIAMAAKAIRESGGDCFSMETNDPDMVRRVRVVAEGLSIKAISNGNADEIRALIEAGADRIGIA